MKKRFLILTMLLVSIFSFQTVSAEESYNILADMSNQTYEILDMSAGGNPTTYVSLVDNYLLLENSTAMSLALTESDFEENSQYTLLLNVVSVSSSYNYFRVYTSYSLFNGAYIFQSADVDVTGVYKILLTSRDDFTDEYSSSFLVLHSNASDVVFRATLLAGDYTSISDATAINIIDNAVYGTAYSISGEYDDLVDYPDNTTTNEILFTELETGAIVNVVYPSKIYEGQNLPMKIELADKGSGLENLDKFFTFFTSGGSPATTWNLISDINNGSVLNTEGEMTTGEYYFPTSTFVPGVYTESAGINGFRYDFQSNIDVENTFVTEYLNFEVIALPDSTPPLIDGATAVHLVNIANPDTVADLKATLTATDDVDGDLTSSITVTRDLYTGHESTLGDYEVDFSVTDSSSNTSTITVIFRVCDVTIPAIVLIGDETVYVEFGENYSELGATWTDDVDGSGTAVASGSVNVGVLGSYTINYDYTDSSSNAAITVSRTVIVRDTTAPAIVLIGDEIVYVEFGENYSELGATWTDDVDGSGTAVASGSVNVGVLGNYTILYNITDASSNAAITVTRTVIVRDTTVPVFTGEITYNYSIVDNIVLDTILQNITANDNYDGDLTSSIVVDSNNFNDQGDIPGTYTVILSVTDSSGNVETITLTINIADNEAPVFSTTVTLFTVEYADSMTQQDIIDYFNNNQ